MKKIYQIVFLFVFAASLISCGKEESVQTPIDGDYTFDGIKVNLTNELNASGIKTVTIMDYSTENNKGSLSFGGSKMSTANVSYSLDTDIRTMMYVGGELFSDDLIPLSGDMQPSSSQSTFELIGTDSIYFKSGLVLTSNQTMPIQPKGAKYKIEGNKLTITMKMNETQTVTNQGVTAIAKANGTVVLSLLKK